MSQNLTDFYSITSKRTYEKKNYFKKNNPDNSTDM